MIQTHEKYNQITDLDKIESGKLSKILQQFSIRKERGK